MARVLEWHIYQIKKETQCKMTLIFKKYFSCTIRKYHIKDSLNYFKAIAWEVGCSSVGRMFAWCAGSSGSSPCHHMELGTVVQACHSRTLRVEAGGSEI